jgi:hypothetical protein
MTTPDHTHTHTANMKKAAIPELDWEILPHQPYSSDLAPSDYHLFRSLSRATCAEFPSTTTLSSKPAYFFKRGIENLPELWEAVVNNGGEYIID